MFALSSLDRCFSESVPSVFFDMSRQVSRTQEREQRSQKYMRLLLYLRHALFVSAATNGDRVYQRCVREIHRLDARLDGEHPTQAAMCFLDV